MQQGLEGQIDHVRFLAIELLLQFLQTFDPGLILTGMPRSEELALPLDNGDDLLFRDHGYVLQAQCCRCQHLKPMIAINVNFANIPLDIALPAWAAVHGLAMLLEDDVLSACNFDKTIDQMAWDVTQIIFDAFSI
jgi:hypothetical protein